MSERRGFTLVELFVTMAIVSLLMGYAWKIYFSGRETMRNTVSQSQMQAETRWFFDQLARDIAAAYRFIEVDPAGKKFSFYCFQTSRRVLEDMLYDTAGKAIAPQDQVIDVLKIEYRLEANGQVKRQQTPGMLNFLRPQMTFTVGPAAQYSGTSNEPGTKTVLHNIADFQFAGYEQEFKANARPDEDPVVIRKIEGTDPTKAGKTSFITLRVHNKIDEKQGRDEELDLVCKFYSRVRLADAAYPGYFSTTDENGDY